jgi:hypothetical protein
MIAANKASFFLQKETSVFQMMDMAEYWMKDLRPYELFIRMPSHQWLQR